MNAPLLTSKAEAFGEPAANASRAQKSLDAVIDRTLDRAPVSFDVDGSSKIPAAPPTDLC